MELLTFSPEIIASVAIFLIVTPLLLCHFLNKSIRTLKLARISALAILALSGVCAACALLVLPLIPTEDFLKLETYGDPRQLGIALTGVSCSLLLAILLLKLSNFSLPKLSREISRHELNAETFKHSYRQLQDDLDNRNIEIEALSTEIERLYEHQYHREIFGSNNVELYRKLFDASPIFYIALSEKDEINDINTYACEVLSYNFGELVSSRFLDIVIPEDRHRVGLLIQSFKKQGKANNEFETEFRDRDRKSHAVTVKMRNFSRGDSQTTYLFCIDNSHSKELSNTLAFQANHDDLTELLNRRALEKYFDNRATTEPKEKNLSLIYFDVDQLKVVNDTCGHTAGDQLLKQLVAILKPVCERYGCNIFARIGGDEFAIVAPDFDAPRVSLFAEALRSAAEDLTFSWDNKSFRQSISVGVAISKNAKIPLKELLSAADAACYIAKEQGRNQVKTNLVEEHDPVVDHRQSMHWVSRLDKAIKNGNFLLNFQPIVSVDKPFTPYIHYEVLLQFVDEKGNKVPPGNFLPSAERFGKSTEIDLWVITETFDFLRKNPEHTRHLSCCSINLTSHSIANHRSREGIISLVKSHNFPARKICFEITETSAISNLSEAIDFIRTLRSLGCRFALDDFGTGFSSFGYLKNLDVDYLKIDGSFIKDLTKDKLDKAMTKAICSIAKEMNIKTVAEYVENEHIMRELKAIGVDLGQGFAIAKPMPIEAIHDFYHDYSAFNANQG